MTKFSMGLSKPRLVDLRGGRNVPPPKPEDVREPRPRRSTLKVYKRRVRAVITAAICVCALLTTYSVHLASYLPRFTFQHVAITGAHTIPPSQIEAYVESRLAASNTGFLSGRNIFIFDMTPLQEELVKIFPRLSRAEVTRDTSLGNGILIKLEERTPFARWCTESGSCYFLDDIGIVFAPVDLSASTTLPTQYIFSGELSSSTLSVVNPPIGETFSSGHFAGIKALLVLLGQAGIPALGAHLENETDFSVPVAEGYYLKVSYGEDPNDLVKDLSLILNSDALKGKLELLEYIDLRFGNRVYYKFKDAPENAAPTAKKSQ